LGTVGPSPENNCPATWDRWSEREIKVVELGYPLFGADIHYVLGKDPATIRNLAQRRGISRGRGRYNRHTREQIIAWHQSLDL